MNVAQEFDVEPNFDFIKLETDQPLFGMSKGNFVLVDSSITPRPGHLVLFDDGVEMNIFRFEKFEGVASLWPGNKTVPLIWLKGRVIKSLVKDFP